MTTPHRTLQMALDALDAITDDVDGTGLNTMPSFDKAIDAIAALREALAPDHLRDVAEKVAPAAPVVPLTDLQLSEIAVSDEFLLYCSQDEFNEIARAIERAHGIAASPQPAPVPLTDTETHAELWKLAVRKGLITVRSELIDPRNHGTRVSWMQGHDKACDISNDAAAHGIAASPEQPK